MRSSSSLKKDELLSIQLLENGAPWWGKFDVIVLMTVSMTPPLSSLRTELVFSVTRELLSVPSSSLSPPLFTPPNLLSLFSRYVDRQRLELLQDKLQ